MDARQIGLEYTEHFDRNCQMSLKLLELLLELFLELWLKLLLKLQLRLFLSSLPHAW